MPIVLNGSGPITGVTSLNTTVSDTEIGYLDGVTSALQTQINNIGVYQTWSPTLSGVTIGNGTMTARYTKIGKFVHMWLDFLFGSTSSATGTFIVSSLPAALAPFSDAAARAAQVQVGCIDDSTGNARWGSSHFQNNNTTRIWPTLFTISSTGAAVMNSSSDINNGTPWTWATNDRFILSATYEGA